MAVLPVVDLLSASAELSEMLGERNSAVLGYIFVGCDAL